MRSLSLTLGQQYNEVRGSVASIVAVRRRAHTGKLECA